MIVAQEHIIVYWHVIAYNEWFILPFLRTKYVEYAHWTTMVIRYRHNDKFSLHVVIAH